MNIKLGVHVLCEDGRKGHISAIEADLITVTLKEGGGTVECVSATLKTLKGRPRKVESAVVTPTAMDLADECESASL